MKRSDSQNKIIIFFHYLLLVAAILFFIFYKENKFPFYACFFLFIFVLIAKEIFKLPKNYYALFVLFAYLDILGQKFGGNLYQYIPQYDKIIHFTTSLIITLLIYSILERNNLKKHVGIISLLCSMGIGAIWEIFEYSSDHLFNLSIKMQGVFTDKSQLITAGLEDTMFDLIAALCGSLLILGMLWLKSKKSEKKRLE